MKKLLNLTLALSIIVLIIIGCKKISAEFEAKKLESNTTFDALYVKHWFYRNFENTDEWKKSWLLEKKYPNWRNGSYSLVGDLEIVEFPLISEKTKRLIPYNSQLSSKENQKIFSSSISKVLLIKNSKKEIFVRLVDYIPDWNYLIKNSFDVSKVSYGKTNDDFTGDMIIKNWNGEILTMRKLFNGKITHKITHNKVKSYSLQAQNSTSLESTLSCIWVRYCMYYQDCVVVADVTTNDCGSPYPDLNDCYDEEVCEIDEEIPCTTYSTGCYDDVPSGECNFTSEEAQNLVDGVTSQITTNLTSESGSSTTADSYGIVRKPWTGNGIGLTLHVYGSYSPRWNTKYSGVLFKNTTSSTWKFEQFAFNSVSQTSGTMAPCFEAEVNTNIATAIGSNGLRGLATGDYSITLKCICLFGIVSTSPFVVPLGDVDEFNAN